MAVPDPEPSSEPAPARSSAWEAPAIGLAFVLVIAGAAWWLLGIPGPEAESGRSKFERAEVSPDYGGYVGDRACRECHPGESAAHSRSGHSRTLRLARLVESARKLDGREVADPERPGVAWRFAFRDGRLSTKRQESGRVEQFDVEYVLGSRRHASTFVTLLDRDPASPTLLEHRLTDFASANELGLTPGQKESTGSPGNTPHGRVIDSWNTLKCLGCHSTVTSNRGSTFLDEATMIPNVSCERCHGPAKGHVEAVRGGVIDVSSTMRSGLVRGTALDQMRFCGECHRTPEMVSPGEIRGDNPVLVRHQPVGLMQSACFLKSEGKLDCSTCHDPHARALTDHASYQARCLECHGSTGQARCSVSPLEGCVGCHMPRRDVGRGMMMSDHWIRVVLEAGR
jgi:Cytochrome c554 and c-prime